MTRARFLLLALCALLFTGLASAAMAQGGGAATVYGTPTSGHCVVWHSASAVTDAGGACGGSGAGLANVYDASGCTVASGTGSADAAACIQGFINTANTAGGGVVWVGAGVRNLKSQIDLKSNVTLSCSSNGFVFDGHSVDYTAKGTVFAVLWGSGTGAGDDATKAAILWRHDTRVEHCGFWYPNQSASAAAPTEYGSTLLVYDSSANVHQAAVDNWCANCYNFLDYRGGIGGIGLGYAYAVGNIGAPIHYGLAVNFTVDWCTFSDNTWNSGIIWVGDPTPASHLRGWIAANGVGYYIGHGDQLAITNAQLWGYKTGFLLDAVTACCSGFVDGPGVVLNHPDIDATSIGYRLSGATQSVAITNGDFVPFNPYTSAPGVLGSLDNGASVISTMISNTIMTSSGTRVLSYNGSGQTVGNVLISNLWATVPSTATYALDIGAATTVSVGSSIFSGFTSGVLNPGTFTNQPTLTGAYQ